MPPLKNPKCLKQQTAAVSANYGVQPRIRDYHGVKYCRQSIQKNIRQGHSMRIHLIPNSHIDPVWLWNKYEGIDEVLNTFRSACDRLDEFPDMTFTASSVQFYEWVRNFDPGLFERISAFVRAGRWEVVGNWWVEPDTNLPRLSSFLKHAQMSRRFTEKHFSRVSNIAFVPDTFGHPADLPLILSETGFKYMLFFRPGPHEKNDLPDNLFYWDYKGRKVLVYRLTNHYQTGGSGNELLKTLSGPEYTQQPTSCFFFGVGDHGGGPTIAEIQFFRTFIADSPKGHAGFSSLQAFFRQAEDGPNIPVYSGDLHRHAVGCYSVVSELKNGVRHAEHALEFAGRAMRMHTSECESLDAAWKQTLFNEFHDILPGSCSPEAAAFAREELSAAAAQARDISRTALKRVSLADRPLVKEGEFRVFNTLPYPVTTPLSIETSQYFKPNGIFRDNDGNEISVQLGVPSVVLDSRRWEFVDTLPAEGFKAYHFDNSTAAERPARGEIHFSPVPNEKDTESGNISTCVGKISALVLGDESDTWGHRVKKYDDVRSRFERKSKAQLTGSVLSRVYEKWQCGLNCIRAIFTSYTAEKGLYIDLSVQWNDVRKICKIEIPLLKPGSGNAWMQGAAGEISREPNGFEQPMHHWIWLPAETGGLAVIQDGCFSCDFTNRRLRMTFVRSSLYGFHDPSVPNENDPQYPTDIGEHSMRMLLLDCNQFDPQELNRAAEIFMEPFPVFRETP